MASFEKLPQLKDLRGKTLSRGSYTDHGAGSKTDIAIHHSLTKVGSSSAFANYHVTANGWPGVAYHFVILKDGTIEWNHNLGIKSYHVGNSNKFAVGICVVGDFRSEEPTTEQKASLFALHECLKRDMPNYKRTRQHQEFPGYAWKDCCAFDYRAVISGADKGGIKVAPAPAEQVKSEIISAPKPAPKPSVSLIRKGDKGETVRAVQSELKKHGFNIALDGIFGGGTEAAVKAFQKAQGLAADGIVGQATFAALAKAAPIKKAIVAAKPKFALPSGILRKGDRGNDVKLLQTALKAAKFDPKGADGIFGADTEDAVRRFQSVHLPYEVDGVFGPKTKAKLTEVLR